MFAKGLERRLGEWSLKVWKGDWENGLQIFGKETGRTGDEKNNQKYEDPKTNEISLDTWKSHGNLKRLTHTVTHTSMKNC